MAKLWLGMLTPAHNSIILALICIGLHEVSSQWQCFPSLPSTLGRTTLSLWLPLSFCLFMCVCARYVKCRVSPSIRSPVTLFWHSTNSAWGNKKTLPIILPFVPSALASSHFCSLHRSERWQFGNAPQIGAPAVSRLAPERDGWEWKVAKLCD